MTKPFTVKKQDEDTSNCFKQLSPEEYEVVAKFFEATIGAVAIKAFDILKKSGKKVCATCIIREIDLIVQHRHSEVVEKLEVMGPTEPTKGMVH